MRRIAVDVASRQAPSSRAWIGWAVAGAALALFAAVALANMQTGIEGDRSNPHPGPPPYPPFLGVTDWPLLAASSSVVLTIALFGYLGWRSISDRRPHWALIIGGAAFVAGALDPLANWATFTVFDPRVAHFPPTWPYFDIAPLLEPTLSFLGGYAAYYVLTGLGLLSLHRRVVEPRLKPGGWLYRHQLAAVFLTGFVAGIPANAAIQFMWLKVGLFVYTQAAGPVLVIGHTHLPVYMIVYDSVLFATVAVLCVRDDRGRPMLVTKLSRALPARAAEPGTARQLVVATAVFLIVWLIPIGVFGALRVGGFAQPSYDRYPYPDVLVYDPYGDLQRAGKPGPFYP